MAGMTCSSAVLLGCMSLLQLLVWPRLLPHAWDWGWEALPSVSCISGQLVGFKVCITLLVCRIVSKISSVIHSVAPLSSRTQLSVFYRTRFHVQFCPKFSVIQLLETSSNTLLTPVRLNHLYPLIQSSFIKYVQVSKLWGGKHAPAKHLGTNNECYTFAVHARSGPVHCKPARQPTTSCKLVFGAV